LGFYKLVFNLKIMALLQNFDVTINDQPIEVRPEPVLVRQYYNATFNRGDTTDFLIHSNVNGTLRLYRICINDGDSGDSYTIEHKLNTGTVLFRTRHVGSEGEGYLQLSDIGVPLGVFGPSDNYRVTVDRTAGSGGGTMYLIIDYDIV